MKMLAGLLLSLSIVGLSSATAQPPGGPGGFGGPPGGAFGGPGGFAVFGADKLMLLGQKPIQEELKVTEKQLAQIEKLQEKQRKSFEELRDMEPEDAERKMTKNSKANDTALGKLLSAEQLKRLGQISIQRRGTRALADADVAKALGLSPSQKNKIQQIQEDAMEEMREAFASFAPPGGGQFGARGPAGQGIGGPGGGAGPEQADGDPPKRPAVKRGPRQAGGDPPGQPPQADAPAGPPPDGQAAEGRRGPGGFGRGTPEQQAAMRTAFDKMDALRKGTDEKMLAVLNSKQQTKWTNMQGEPFKFEMPRPDFQRRGQEDAAPDGPPERGKQKQGLKKNEDSK